MIRIRTKIGESRVLTILQGEEWITIATGLASKTSASLLEAGQNHLMCGRALYLKQQEEEHLKNRIDLGPRPGETWSAK